VAIYSFSQARVKRRQDITDATASRRFRIER